MIEWYAGRERICPANEDPATMGGVLRNRAGLGPAKAHLAEWRSIQLSCRAKKNRANVFQARHNVATSRGLHRDPIHKSRSSCDGGGSDSPVPALISRIFSRSEARARATGKPRRRAGTFHLTSIVSDLSCGQCPELQCPVRATRKDHGAIRGNGHVVDTPGMRIDLLKEDAQVSTVIDGDVPVSGGHDSRPVR